MLDFFEDFSELLENIPDFIYGILYLLIAFGLACLGRFLVVKLLDKLGLDKKLASKKADENAPKISAVSIIGKLVFVVIFVLFVPEILARFGMSTVTSPIIDMINTFIAFIPNVVACVLILWIGLLIASIIKQLVVAAVNLTKVEKLQAKLTNGKANIQIAKLIGTVVYVVIAAVVIICALNVLGIEAISAPTTAILSTLIASIPSIILAVIVLFIGLFIASLVASFLATILNSMGLDEKFNKWLACENCKNVSIVKIATGIVKAVIVALFIVETVNVLNLEVLTFVATAILSFLPSAIVIVLFAIAAFIVCRLIDKNITTEKGKKLVKLAKIAVIVLASFIVLSHIGIAPVIVNTAFVVAVVACGVAFALAVGLGGREFVKNFLANVKCCKKDEENK